MKKLLTTSLLAIMSLMTFSQNTINVKKKTLINIKKEIEKCDSLKVRYDELLENLTTLQNEIEQSTNKIKELNADKAVLRNEITSIDRQLLKEQKKRFNVSLQLGSQSNFINNNFSVTPYFGIGVGLTIFRF